MFIAQEVFFFRNFTLTASRYICVVGWLLHLDDSGAHRLLQRCSFVRICQRPVQEIKRNNNNNTNMNTHKDTQTRVQSNLNVQIVQRFSSMSF